ncbi:PEP-CTERM putative exosortase interaction domain-containing protein [Rivularia sp. PCC 7116]|uniref:exosortase-dependent surface protein XDP2 n=1 Tax=Rivularia sp. PCC 7116 TaxID=373994 RepID=UPI00029EC428|nr:exosortase-dependent surface protein XDP2 [Rivularia sp. PCC 7116]AFY53768.1 PEP-CTERM putative exosortase interaction domain-containing protein [Rivularia sp. PCC 7116]
MKFSKLATSIGLTVGSVLFVANSAQAAGFKSNVTLDQNNLATGDVILNSIEQNGTIIDKNEFNYVDRVVIQHNDQWTEGNTGAASTDRGDNASNPLGISETEDPTANEIAAFLGNNNLNNIIDTEDDGKFELDLFFDSVIQEDNLGLDSLFFWERGTKNSDLLVTAIDASGNLGTKAIRLDRANQVDAGFNINTTEVGQQDVGSWGLSLEKLGVTSLSGIRVYADAGFKGPDFKVIARSSSTPDFAKASVPEPGTIIGLGSVAALAFFRRRKSK